MNYFAQPEAARRYAHSRPYFHPLVVRRIAERTGLRGRALDVGCGTGQSTIALAAIAREVVGTDISAEMLREAPRTQGVFFLVADAHRLPFADASFALLTVSMAFHWLDRARFLAEAKRVLGAGGWLVIYNNFFFGTMEENEEFARWHREVYLARYPSPPRASQPLAAAEAARHQFTFHAPEDYTNTVSFSAEELAGYLTTQSNIIAAVEQRGETFEQAEAWLADELSKLFPAPRCAFRFGGHIWLLQSVSAGKV